MGLCSKLQELRVITEGGGVKRVSQGKKSSYRDIVTSSWGVGPNLKGGGCGGFSMGKRFLVR